MRRSRILVAVAAAAVSLCVAQSASAAANYEAGQVIVKPKAGVALTRVLSLSTVGGPLQQVEGVGATVVSVKGSVPDAVKTLEASGLVAYAEPNYILKATATPNDALFGQLYGMQKISAPAGWDAAGLGSFPSTGGVKVGIVDTGIDQNHEDLRGKTVACAQSRGLGGILSGSIQTGPCADDNDHGSHVAGTLAGNANNSVGVAGVAFNSPLVICRALGGPLGSGSTSDVANCITWTSQQGAKVISMSLGGGDSTTLHTAVTNAYANGNGALIVAAAGNDGADGKFADTYPAAYDGVLAVGASDRNDERAFFSQSGDFVDVAAPGVGMVSTVPGGGQCTADGTSFAAPYVAGVAALLKEKHPEWKASQIATRIEETAQRPGRGPNGFIGWGVVDPVAALSDDSTPGTAPEPDPPVKAGSGGVVPMAVTMGETEAERERRTAVYVLGTGVALALVIAGSGVAVRDWRTRRTGRTGRIGRTGR
jgi:subtilisin family serine protease